MAGYFLAPTATKIPPEASGEVLLTGSHGGAYVGYLAARAGLRALIASDAGVGKDQAGIGSLSLCDAIGMACAAISHDSARIGDAAHMLKFGVVSHVNRAAADCGCAVGQSCEETLACITQAPMPEGEPPVYAEARSVVGHNRHGLSLVCIDSVSLVVPEDAGQIVVSGSHGALVAGQHHLAIRVQAAAAFFNDAGFGFDNVGSSRLPVLHDRGVAAATVAAASARIGDARSTLEDGCLSAVNALAEELGMRVGMCTREAVEKVVEA